MSACAVPAHTSTKCTSPTSSPTASTAYRNDDIAEVVRYLGDETYDPTGVVTHHFAQTDVEAAFRTALEDTDTAIRVVIDVHP